MAELGNVYQEQPEEVIEAGELALLYIFEGDQDDMPYDIRGLCVFGIVGVLREHDAFFYADDAILTQEERTRLEEIEGMVDKAIDQRRHYYPFGHDADRYWVDQNDQDARQRAMTNSKDPLGKLDKRARLSEIHVRISQAAQAHARPHPEKAISHPIEPKN